jgi:membrane protease YdiL (CAAX protease family)
MRLFFVLLGLSVLGVAASAPYLSFALSSLAVTVPLSPAALFAVQAIQTLALAALAAYAGVRLAPRANLDAPWLRAIADRSPLPPAFAGVAIEGVALGSLAAVATAAALLPFRSWLPAASSHPPNPGFWTLASSGFYGGIVEEILVRWGVLSALVVLLRKLGARDGFWAANVLAALVFAAGHLPAARVFGMPLDLPAATYLLVGNGLPGLLFGWLFRRRGLEAAMVAHGAADVWLHAALPILLA